MGTGRLLSAFIFLTFLSTGIPVAGAHDRASIESVSERYLGRPYLLGNLGEGSEGLYDQDPLFRADAFDCQTLVEAVLAEVLAKGPSDFLPVLNSIRYREGRVGYFDRNHFPEVDWIPNNTATGRISEMSGEISPDAVRIARVFIDRPGWVDAHGLASIQIPGLSVEAKRRRLEELKQDGRGLQGEWAEILYVPSRELLEFDVRERIPSGSILSVVRENWLPAGGGTAMAISHMGFAIWKDGVLYYRNASSTEKSVVDIRLTDYVKKVLQSSTVKGFNVQRIAGSFR